MGLQVGRWYPTGGWSWVKVIRYAPDESPTFPFLVRSLFWGVRWWADSCGEANNHRSPKIIAR